MQINLIKTLLILTFPLMALPMANAKDGMLENALGDAMNRSSDEQRDLRKKVQKEKSQRMDQWAERREAAIEINNSIISVPSNFDVGIEADLDIEEGEEDNSGLNKLRSDVEEESTDINFDEELREVSLAE